MGFSECKWFFYAVVALCCFASNNFLLNATGKTVKESYNNTTEGAIHAADANVTGMLVIWMVAGVCGIFGGCMMGDESLRNGLKGCGNLVLCVFTGLVNMAAMLLLALALAADPDNAGPITAVLPLNSLIVSGLAYLFLNESLGKQELLGMMIAMIGPMLMSAADTSDNALKGIGYGGLTAVGFGVSNFLRKMLMKKGGCSGNAVVVVIYCTIGACSLIAVGVSIGYRGGMPGLTFLTTLYVIASGFLWVTGGLFFQWALMGKAGPASAVTNTNSVGVLILSIVFFHIQLVLLKVVGMAFCIVGVAVLSIKRSDAVVSRNFNIENQSEDSSVSLQPREEEANNAQNAVIPSGVVLPPA